MPESKHFFEGYSRSKNMLATLADKITSATIERPWTLKSSGYITSTNSAFNTRPHVCLRREMHNGDILNVLFVDAYNTNTNNIFGNIAVYFFWNDGCDVANDRYMYLSDSNAALTYHANQVADSDATPQFGWHWIWVDEDGICMSVFGNVGAAGTATADYKTIYFGIAKAHHEKFKDSFCWFDADTSYGALWDASMKDFMYPDTAPHTWTGNEIRVVALDILESNTATSNPSVWKNKFAVSRPILSQGTDQHTSSPYTWIRERLQTHWFGNGQFFYCLPGSTLYRGDIIVIESEGCDFIYQSLGATEYHRNLLIKRMESVTNLVVAGTSNNVALNWRNPKKCYGVKILRKLDVVPANSNDGSVVFDLNINTGLLAGTEQSFTDTNAATGTYYYRAFAYSSNGVYSVPVSSASNSIVL